MNTLAERLKAGLRSVLPRRPGTPRRVRVPTVLQMEAVECGAAALAMVLAHHGRIVPLEELRMACGVSRDGSKASNMVRAARAYGLEAKGFKREPQALRGMPLPMIIHWNFNHFVVLEGFDRRGRVHLNDPGHGARVVTGEELDQSFTGVALTFQPDAEFVRGGERRSLMDALRRRLAGSQAALLFCVLAGLALVVPGLMVPTFTRVFVDDVLVKGMGEWVRPLLLAMGATVLVLGGLTWLQQHYLLRLETRLALQTSSRFFWHVLHLPVHFFTQRNPGEIASRVAINDRVAQLLSGELAMTVLRVATISFYAGLMVWYDAWLTAMVVGVAALNLGVLRFVSRRRTDLSQRLQQDRGKALGTAMGGLLAIETLKAGGSESDFFARWSGHYARVVNAQHQLGLQTQLLSLAPPLLLASSTALLLGVGGARVMDGELTMGMLIAFHALALAFLGPVNGLVALGGTIQEVRGDVSRLDDVLRYPAQAGADPVPGDDGAATAARLTGEVELRQVSFGYSRLEPALIQGFSLRLRPGSRVALVGGSGCGKSTIARLVAGLYEPWAGEILFDGVPRSAIPRDVLTQSLAVVDQEVFLFEGTVRDNLALWDPGVPEPDLVQAARDACIHEDVGARPGSYSAPVEEGGRNLSGGQRQRMEVARALVSGPAVLVLDEATSALDPATEKQIDDNLRRRGCTCLIVAHRLSTIRDCDEIIVLDGGKIAQRGTHEELKDVPGPYADLIAAE
jgi:NHLM bacteriocin system ABC transporter peptidase/ATP-binding protein